MIGFACEMILKFLTLTSELGHSFMAWKGYIISDQDKVGWREKKAVWHAHVSLTS